MGRSLLKSVLALVVLAIPVSGANAATGLLSGTGLTPQQITYLDRQGHNNGGLDLGDQATLVAAGLAASDGFAGLRVLVAADQGKPWPLSRRPNLAGRWNLIDVRRGGPSGPPEADVEHQAWSLLQRYGVVFRRLLTREVAAAPWRELTRVYRRLEARGEIRGGRFVAGMAGEQYALPDAVPVLREVRRTPPTGAFYSVSTADPLNLAGIVTAGARVAARGRNRIAYRDGVPVAVFENQVFKALQPLDAAESAEAARVMTVRILRDRKIAFLGAAP